MAGQVAGGRGGGVIDDQGDWARRADHVGGIGRREGVPIRSDLAANFGSCIGQKWGGFGWLMMFLGLRRDWSSRNLFCCDSFF